MSETELREALAECDAVCTSGCHADDCEHHGHLPAASIPAEPERADEVAGLDLDALETALWHASQSDDLAEYTREVAAEYADARARNARLAPARDDTSGGAS